MPPPATAPVGKEKEYEFGSIWKMDGKKVRILKIERDNEAPESFDRIWFMYLNGFIDNCTRETFEEFSVF